MTNITAWPNPTGRPQDPPKPIIRPCDYGLLTAIHALETQLGTIEAYNRLVTAAERLRAQIDAGKAKPQNPLFAVSVRGAP
jgi:hypothetical protein